MASPDQEILLAREEEGERESAAKPRQHGRHRRDGVVALPHGIRDELGHHLGVRLSLEGYALGL